MIKSGIKFVIFSGDKRAFLASIAQHHLGWQIKELEDKGVVENKDKPSKTTQTVGIVPADLEKSINWASLFATCQGVLLSEADPLCKRKLISKLKAARFTVVLLGFVSQSGGLYDCTLRSPCS